NTNRVMLKNSEDVDGTQSANLILEGKANGSRQLDKGNNKSSNNKDKIKSHLVTLELYKDGQSLQEIAKSRSLNVRTLEDHLLKCSQEGHHIPWDDFIPSGQETLILEAVTRVGTAKLSPIKEVLPEEVSYFTIRAVLEKRKLLSS
nr:helix-turn-helix domain-containing protein [Desulfitobacterium hafniense]